MRCVTDECRQGREKCPTPRECGCLHQAEGGFTFYGPEPDDDALYTMLWTAVAGVLAVFVAIGMLAFFVYTIAPIVAASLN